ncbi:nickel-dependent lactate racemase [uncultured Sphaerochaeta sp.]|uniref:nickel-dependent lactate racemase n=1 Tax=uncultured Sphaerochaeta sp. TaxID=886478 RepID=UPI002A0A85D2|nr:nickel-dependent lactate racemase [uncultured Sphaerochaeta sp.]
MQVEYKRKSQIFSVGTENLLGTFEPNPFPLAGNPFEAITQACKQPSRGVQLDAFLEGAKTVLVIVNDATRPTPTSEMLQALLPVLAKHGIGSQSGLTILIATGAHRGAKDQEFSQILGSLEPSLRNCCISHDARDKESLVYLGTTRNQTPIILNKLLFNSDRIIVTGSVEPHYFAGFTGGRKAFLPGIAGYDTIVANHKLALSPKAHSLALEGNPVHEDMMDALNLIKVPIFSLMAILDSEQKIAAMTAGNIQEAFFEAVKIAKQIFCVSIPEQADVVVSVAKFPMDINLYQSQKAIDNGALAVKDGGTLILVSSCREGLGDETFAKLLSQSSSPDDALLKISAEYKLGYHKAAKMAAVAKRIKLEALTELEDSHLSDLFITPVHDLQKAIDQALDEAKKRGISEPKVLVLPDGCVTVPEI